MAISSEEVAQVRASTDLVALIGEHSALKRQGRRWLGLCPFHSEKTPSFSVNAEEGLYYCFGCQASGDAITFVREIERLDFVDAVRLLADRAGVVIHEDASSSTTAKLRTQLLSAMEQAVEWYHERLLSAPDAGPARDYLRSRGYDGDVVRKFRLGWAPDEWDALSRALNLEAHVLAESGLGFVNRAGRTQDAFRSRIIFPICDPSGRPIALGGRVLPPVDPNRAPATNRRAEPKYKNSQETPIYSKRRTLYALNWAKTGVISADEVVVCEGYTDVIGLFQVGVERAVATCGTALGEDHFKLLRNFAKRVVLAYDADSAGQSATSRVYEWERRHDVDVAVAALPAGSDPADLARSDPDALLRAVNDARPFLGFRVERVFQDADLVTPEGRAHVADAALAVVAEHPDELVRGQYLMQIADRCRLSHDLVRTRLAAAVKRATRRPTDNDDDHGSARPPRRSGSQSRGESRPGLEALRLIVHRRDEVSSRFDPILFADPLHKSACLVLMNSDSLAQAASDSPGDVADLLYRVAVEDPIDDVDSLGDPVDSLVTQLVREAAKRALADELADARAGGRELEALQADTARVRLWLEDLEDPAACKTAVESLLAWLRERSEEV